MTQPALADFLLPDGFAGPQGLRALAREGSAVTELLAARRRVRSDRAVVRRTPYAARSKPVGLPILLIPGFLAGDYSLAGMHGALRREGHRTYRAGIRANVGCIDTTTAALEARVEQIIERRQTKVTLVGHSLGGMLSRGLAARRPDLIAGVVTMGSPMLAPGAAHPILVRQVALLRRLSALGAGRLMGEDCTSGACALRMWEESQLAIDPAIPFTAIYSRRDGITDWRACIDPAAEAREVRTSHIGMAFDPVVFDVVLEAVESVRRRPAGSLVAGWARPASDVG